MKIERTIAPAALGSFRTNHDPAIVAPQVDNYRRAETLSSMSLFARHRDYDSLAKSCMMASVACER